MLSLLLPILQSMALAAAPSPVDNGGVFVGVVARDAAFDGLASRVDVALSRAFARNGVRTLSETPTAARKATTSVEDLSRLLADARGRFFDGEFAAVVAQCDDGIARFESSFAYTEGDDAWRVYSDLMLVRVLALRRLDREDAADRALAALAAQRPDYVPDPGLTPPRVVERHKEIVAKLAAMKKKTVTVESAPAGATVVVDGRKAGITPLVLKDLLPGPHYVVVVRGEERDEQFIVLKDKSKKVKAKFEAPMRDAIDGFRSTLKAGTSERALADLAVSLGPPVLACVAETKPGSVTLLIARVEADGIVGVSMIEIKDDLRTLDNDVALLVDAALMTEGEFFVDGQPATAAKARFLGGPSSTKSSTVVDGTVAEEEESSFGLVAGGIGAAVVGIVIVGIGTAVVVGVLLSQPPNPGGTDVVIDASRL